MTKNSCFGECKNLFYEFLKEEKISYFEKFCFKDLYEKKIENYKGKFRAYIYYDKNGVPHADSSRLARIIYYILWGNHEYTRHKFQNLIDADTSFDSGEDKFCGDTLITTNSFDADTTIGNFMILPKGKASNGVTLNQYRGVSSGLNDNFSKFMNIIKNFYEEKAFKDKIWQELFENKYNLDFFNQIGKIGEKGDKFQNFVEFFMLEDWEKLESCNQKEVVLFIKKRSKRICQKLKTILNNVAKSSGME